MGLVLATNLFLSWLLTVTAGECPPALVGDTWGPDWFGEDPYDYLAGAVDAWQDQEQYTPMAYPTDWDSHGDHGFDWPGINEAWQDLIPT